MTPRPSIPISSGTALASAVLAGLMLASAGGSALVFTATRLGGTAAALAATRDPARAFAIGQYFFNGGAYDLGRAERAFRRALALDPAHPRANYQLARVLFLGGRFSEALEAINRELLLYPDYGRSFYIRGLIQGYRRDYSAAEEDFRSFIAWSPGEWPGYNDLAWVEMKQGKFSEAEAAIREAFTRIPEARRENLWLWTNLGVALLNQRAYNEAMAAFEQALAVSRQMDAGEFWRAYPGNDPREAERQFRSFRAALHFNLALAYDQGGRAEQAAAAYAAHRDLAGNDTLPFAPAP